MNHPNLFEDQSCIGMTRTLFGPKIDADDDELHVPQALPAGFPHENLQTLKYFYHDAYGEKSMNGHLKVLLNVQQWSDDELSPENIWSVHRPNKDRCPPVEYYHTPETDVTSVFRVHHYLGTWDNFSGRVDPRRNQDIFDNKATSSSRFGPNYEIQPWIHEFIGSEQQA